MGAAASLSGCADAGGCIVPEGCQGWTKSLGKGCFQYNMTPACYPPTDPANPIRPADFQGPFVEFELPQPRPGERWPVERRLWSKIGPKDPLIDDLRKGYCMLRSFSNEDHRSLIRQTWLHDYFCGAGDLHRTWGFLPWHRGFIYFHERILASVLCKPEFRLPVWDWENDRRIPQFYLDLGLPDFLHGGWDRTPPADPNHLHPPLIDDCILEGWLLSDQFEDYCGRENGSPPGHAVSGPHGNVHNGLVGGAMASPPVAAADPVFYVHHTNMDRYWWSWSKFYKNLQPTAGFWEQSFFYYDERQQLVHVKASQLRDEAALGYSYKQPKGLCDWGRLDLLNQAGPQLKHLAVAAFMAARKDLKGAAHAGEAEIAKFAGELKSSHVELAKMLPNPCSSGLTLTIGGTVDKVQPGVYYLVQVRHETGNDGYTVGGFGLFSGHDHDTAGPQEVFVTCCLEPDACDALLHWTGPMKFVYGIPFLTYNTIAQVIGTITVLDLKLFVTKSMLSAIDDAKALVARLHVEL